MKNTSDKITIGILFLTLACLQNVSGNQEVLKLHPQNNHYFLFNGRPTILITSAEHYGAVMNTDFDFARYLETLKQSGFNYTRIFIGPYSEMGSDNFGISNNTMDPRPDKWLTPWIKDPATQRYDLANWNPSFFDRLKAFVDLASENGIVVEVTLFTSYYVGKHWEISPFFHKNNINALDPVPFTRVNTLYNEKLMGFQEQYVRKVVRELNACNNIFFEIQNEPWSDNPNVTAYKSESGDNTISDNWKQKVEIANNVSLEWQQKISSIIVDEESRLPNKHLVAQNICNLGTLIGLPNPLVSIYNFHYALPDAALVNLDVPAVMGLDETGFAPHNDFTYRKQAWDFILSGGALYNNLDYSFIVGKEDGTHPIDERTPGWGGPDYRNQLKILKSFMEGFDFIRMKPENTLIKEDVAHGAIHILAQEGKQYAIYIGNSGISALTLGVPDGNFKAEWIDTLSGSVIKTETVISKNRMLIIDLPPFKEDIALRLINL